MKRTSPSCDLPPDSLQTTDPRIISILDAYLDRLEDGTDPNVDELIARHPELADELTAYFQSIDFLQQGAARMDDSSNESALLEDWAGRTLGDYEILREVGRGGMGIVYEARQSSLGRRVAVKVLPFAAVLDRRQITRFTIEAQAAAQLQHPHIVPVYGVGCDRGVHYYSMQLIGGQSLDATINKLREFRRAADNVGRNKSAQFQHESNVAPLPELRKALFRPTARPAGRSDSPSTAHTSEQRFSTERSTNSSAYVRSVARLGIEAAEALQHAHDCGVVHRDVKPSNLMLDEDGKLWVTDFGLARFATEASLTLTGAVLGTVRYMSPEQAVGDSNLVDHRTDIYSLGVTLYELLTLRSVFNAQNREQFLRQVELSEPRLPRRINSAIPVDLETIILKALSKRRNQRYATARAMADDLRRFLEGSPIAARRPSLVDRAVKWTIRHKAVVLASLALLFLMFLGACLAVLLIAREQRETAAALARFEANFRQTRDELGSFAVLVSDRLAEVPRAEPLRQQILHRTVSVYDGLIEQANNDPSLKADLAVTCFKAGELRERMGQTHDALDLYQRAAALMKQLQDNQPSNEKLDHDLAACYNNAALLKAGLGDFSAARTCFEDAIRLQRKSIAASENPENGLALASMLHNLGALLQQTGETDDATRYHEESLATYERLSEQHPENEHVRRELALSYNNLSFLQRDADLPAAIRRNEQALAVLRNSAVSRSQDFGRQADLALSLSNQGALLSRGGNLREARLAYEEAVAGYTKLAKRSPAVIAHRRDLAVTLNNLGRVMMELNDATAAAEYFAQARDTLAVLVEDAPDELSYRSSLGGVLNNLAKLYEHAGRVDEAATAYEQALEHQRFSLSRAPNVQSFRAFLVQTCDNYARLLRAAGEENKAAHLATAKSAWLANLDAGNNRE